MATNLLISHPDIWFRANGYNWNIAASSSNRYQSGSTDLHRLNAMTGPRSQYFKCSTAIDEVRWDFALPSGITSSVDHLIIARMDYLLNLAATTYNVEVRGDSSTTFGGAALLSDTTIGAGDLIDFDYILYSSTPTSAFRYWQVKLYATGTPSLNHIFSKMYLGSMLDLGKDPESIEIQRVPISESQYYPASGAVHLGRIGQSIYKIKIDWIGISDEKTEEFSNKIERYKHWHTYFLYTKTNHEVLDNKRLLHCKLVSSSTSNPFKGTDGNSISASFEELVG